MTGVAFLPALLEIGRLLLILAVVIVAILGIVRLNYLSWRSPFYLPFMLVCGIGFAYILHNRFNADGTVVFFSAAIPIATGLFFKHALKGRFQSPIMFAAPAIVGVFLLFMYPLAFEVYLAFHKLNLESIGRWIRTGEIEFAGLENFAAVFQSGSAVRESFWAITGRTFLWTGINLFFHVIFGVALAMLLNQKIKGVPIYRTILILPWAIPQLIAVLAWRGEFHSTYGYVNHIIDIINNVFRIPWGDGSLAPLQLIGVDRQEWWTNPNALFASICIVNVWLGIPFMMIVALSGLQAIPRSYYEAASIDGASRLRQFRSITIPLLTPVMVPAAILGMIWTFNNVNVVYLMTAQRGGSEGADILVSDLYKQAFFFNRFSFSAAYAVIIFLILLVLTAIWLKASKIADTTPR